MFTTPPRQSSLPKGQVKITEHQKFMEPTMARVTKNDNYFTQGKIEVTFINRTKPVPIWVLNTGASVKPEVGDFVIVGYIDGQKNNPFMMGLVAHKAWTSNFIRVEKGMVRIQFPTNASDINQDAQTDPKNHLRNDNNLSSRSYIQIDANGVTLHAADSVPITLNAKKGVTINGKNGTTTF